MDGEPGGLQSTESQRGGHDWIDLAHIDFQLNLWAKFNNHKTTKLKVKFTNLNNEKVQKQINTKSWREV